MAILFFLSAYRWVVLLIWDIFPITYKDSALMSLSMIGSHLRLLPFGFPTNVSIITQVTSSFGNRSSWILSLKSLACSVKYFRRFVSIKDNIPKTYSNELPKYFVDEQYLLYIYHHQKPPWKLREIMFTFFPADHLTSNWSEFSPQRDPPFDAG